jgi:hypothetical protein
MYKAATLLAGYAAQKAVGAPGLLAILTGSAAVETIPAAGVMAGIRMPGLIMNFHSFHALVLFNALRAESKYGHQRDKLRAIQDAMEKFIKSIDAAIDVSSPVPATLPDADASVLFDPKQMANYTKQLNQAITYSRSFVDALDPVLDDIARCLTEWNKFLRSLKKLLANDKPRNVFEVIGYYSVHQERDWAWYTDETGFSSSCNELLRHRNRWAGLLDLARRGALPRLDFGMD